MIKFKTMGVLILSGDSVVASLAYLVKMLQGQVDYNLLLIAFVGLGALFIANDD